ncbi:MAG: 3'-5' exonuclease [Chloroflexota bacterium]
MDPRRQAIIAQSRQLIADKPVYIDTETTGLDRTAEIVEIAVIDSDGSTLFHSLVKPFRPIPSELTQIHGIDNQMVEKAVSFPVIWTNLRAKILNRKIGFYNADFDLRMMRQSFEVYRLPWKDTLASFDVMQLYAALFGEWDPTRRAYRFVKLEDAGRRLKIPLPNSHRAVDDALLTRALLHAIAELAN